MTSTILAAGTISIAEFLLRPGTQLFCHQNCGSIEGIWVACTVVLRKHARYTLIRLYIYCISRKHCRPRLAPSLSALRVQHILWRDTRVGLADYNKGLCNSTERSFDSDGWKGSQKVKKEKKNYVESTIGEMRK